MLKWFALVGLMLWLAGITAILVTRSWGVVREPVRLLLSDGTPIHATLYRPAGAAGRLPGAVIVHGLALGRQSCAPALALPLARQGYLTLTIDLAGHGQSGGSVPRSQLEGAPDTFDTPTAHPEIEAGIRFLEEHPQFLRRPSAGGLERIALVGHSRGGWAAADVGCCRPDLAGVVSIGAAPGACDRCRPRNFLILTGGQETIVPLARCRKALARATGGAVRDPGKPFGDFGRGTARRLLVVGGANHFTELADPAISRRVVQWLDCAVASKPNGVRGGELLILVPAVLLASCGGGLACTWGLARAARRLGRQEALSPRPGSPVRLGVFFLLLGALVPLLAAVSGQLEAGPVFFALPAVALLAGMGCTCLAMAGRSRPQEGVLPTDRAATPWMGLGLGVTALALSFLWFGAPWGLTWSGLVPAPHRLLLALILMPLLLPWSLALAHGLERLLGRGAPRWTALAGGLTWLGVALTLWFAHQFLATGRWPLFIVPVGFLAASLVPPLPLWLLPPRPGLALARGICHAGAASWLLACHLPFVHAG